MIKRFVCADYLCFPQNNFHVANKGFEKRNIQRYLVIGIPELFKNAISCHGFVNYKK